MRNLEQNKVIGQRKDKMEYIQIKNLEKYHPGYADRNLIWCKVYFSIMNSDPNFEMLCEIDKWRFIALIILQLQSKKPIPYDKDYLQRKGFDYKKRPMSLTLKMLHNFVTICGDSLRNRNVDIDIDIDKEENIKKSKMSIPSLDFQSLWDKYPNKVGRKDAEAVFKRTVLSEERYALINTALDNYLKSERVGKGFVQNAKTWFRNWEDWIVDPEPKKGMSDLERTYHATK